MTPPNRDSPDDPTNEPSASESGHGTTDEETKLVVEFTVSAEDFVLAETVAVAPEKALEFEQFVPTSQDLLSLLWATDDGMEGFEKAALNDQTVESIRHVAELNDGALYRITWSESADRLLTWLQNRTAVVLQAKTVEEGWLLKLRVDSREIVSDLQTLCRAPDNPPRGASPVRDVRAEAGSVQRLGEAA